MYKKLIIILAITSLSCSKEVYRFCWDCTITTTATAIGFNQVDEVRVCDWTEQDQEDFEKQGTSTRVSSGVTIKQETICILAR